MKRIIICLVAIVLSILPSIASAETNCKRLKQHSQTFYWAALEEFGSRYYLSKSKKYFDLYIQHCKGKNRDSVFIESFDTELSNQFNMSSDTMAGLWPVSQFMTKEIFDEHINLKNYVMYDPDVNISALNSSLENVIKAFTEYNLYPAIKTIVLSNSFRDESRHKDFESEAIYTLNKSGQFYVVDNSILTESLEVSELKALTESDITPLIVSKLRSVVKDNNIFIVLIEELDEIEGTYFFKTSGKILNLKENKIVRDFHSNGFSHNLHHIKSKLNFICGILLLLALLYSFSDYFTVTSKLLVHSHGQQLVMSCLLFALGFFIPNDFIMPMLASISPDPDEVLVVSWWWPILTYVLCLTLTPTIVRGVSSIVLRNSTKISFKLYDDKNFVVLGAGNVLSFLSIYLTYDSAASDLSIFLVTINILTLYSIMGRYMQSTNKSQVVTLLLYFPAIIFSGVAYLSASEQFMIYSSLFALCVLGLVLVLDRINTRDSFICDLTEEAEFDTLFSALKIVHGKETIDRNFFMRNVDTEGCPVTETKTALENEQIRWINVYGESGSGKSLVIHEAVNEYKEKLGKEHKVVPFTINATCNSLVDGDILGVFRRAIKQLPDDIYNKAGQENKNSFFEKILELALGDLTDLNSQSEEKEFKVRSTEILDALIIAASKRPIVVIIEDCHILDIYGQQFLPMLADMFIFNKDEKYKTIKQNLTFVFGARECENLLSYKESAEVEVLRPTIEEVGVFYTKVAQFSDKASDDVVKKLPLVDNRVSWKDSVSLLKDLAYTDKLILKNGVVELVDKWESVLKKGPE